MDRYDFMSLVDDIFKECQTLEDVANRYVQMKKDLDSLYLQNLDLKRIEFESQENYVKNNAEKIFWYCSFSFYAVLYNIK